MCDNETNWQLSLQNIHLPRWDELPDIDIYMEQLVTLVERYTEPFKVNQSTHPLLTASMVNNYVKQKLIPAPIKKRYDKRHIARLIILTILKQAFDIAVVQKGIELQIKRSQDYSLAYEQFCNQMEETIQLFFVDENTVKFELDVLDTTYQPIQLATIALTSKLVTENMLNQLTQNNQTKPDNKEYKND